MNTQLVDLSRLQFALTVAFHMTFPSITVGLSLFLVLLYGSYLKTKQPIYLTMYRFWRNIFAVGFGLGVVAGSSASTGQVMPTPSVPSWASSSVWK